jgi:hypothetical protein
MSERNRRHLGRARQAALYNARRRHHPVPVVYVLGGLPDAAANAGQEAQVIDRNDRIAVSNGVAWVWRGTDEVVS